MSLRSEIVLLPSQPQPGPRRLSDSEWEEVGRLEPTHPVTGVSSQLQIKGALPSTSLPPDIQEPQGQRKAEGREVKLGERKLDGERGSRKEFTNSPQQMGRGEVAQGPWAQATGISCLDNSFSQGYAHTTHTPLSLLSVTYQKLSP